MPETARDEPHPAGLTSVSPDPLFRPLTPVPATVLVSVPDDRLRRQVTELLDGAGFTVLSSSSWARASELLAEHRVDIAVVDSAVSDYYSDPPALTRDGGPDDVEHDGPVPIIFLVDDPSRFDWDAYAQLDRAETVATTVIGSQLAATVCALIRRLERQRAENRADDRLRAAVRQISASIRTSNEPTVITERLVRGIAEAFDVDVVHFTTLQDGRVPELAVEWSRRTGELVPLDLDGQRAAVQGLATQLWKSVAAYRIKHRVSVPADHPNPTALTAIARAIGVKSAISVAVGVGDSPFGILWLANTERSRSWSDIEVALLQDLAGNVGHGMMQGQVILDQREVLHRLERLDRAKNNFLTTVNHELRTPLTTLTAYLDLLQHGPGAPLPVRAVEMLDVAQRNAARLGSLIEDLLTVSRMAVNDPLVDWAPVDLTSLTRRVVDRLRTAAADQGVDLAATVGEGVVVDGDAGQLEQVIFELAENAVKFTGPHGRVQILLTEHHAAEQEPAVRVEISDTGVGIPAEEVSELFTSFFRGSSAQASAAAGTGLGLAIASGLVHAHHGRVSVDNRPGGGTRVRVELPKTRRR